MSPARTGRRVRVALLLGLLALCTAAIVARASSDRADADVPDVALTSLGTFVLPLYATSPPGDPGRIFVVEREGTVRVVKNGVVLPTPFLDVSDEVGDSGERGLLSIAFAPDYAVSGLVYAFAAQVNGTLAVWEFHAGPGADVADAGHFTVLSIPHSASNHNGGQLQFGPDGYLYIGIGDNADDSNGQDTTVPLGKILRIAPHAGAAYTIPPGQPFAPGAAPEIYAYGLRNPWRFSFDPATGDLLVADVGDAKWEEIDRLPAGQPPGANFGWTCLEGTHAHASCTAPGAIPPIHEYAHDDAHCSITGGYVSRDPSVPALAGRYLYADYCGAGVNAINLPVGTPPEIGVLGAAQHIAGFGSDSDGHLYITSLDGGVWRVTGPGGGNKPPVASFTLSTTTPAAGARVHLDASGSTDPDGAIAGYQWDVDGDGKTDGTGVTFDVTYPTPGARPVTLTVADAAGARSSRTQGVFVGGRAPVATAAARKLTAKISVPAKQKLKNVRKRGLLVRFRSNTSATWRVTVTMSKVGRLHTDRLSSSPGRLARKTFAAHAGSGTLRLRIPLARLKGMRTVVIRVQARAQANGATAKSSVLVRVGA